MSNSVVLLNILNNALNGNNMPLENIDDELMIVLKEQCFLPMLWFVSKKKEYKAFFLQSFIVHEKIDKISNNLKNILDSNNVKHVFLKGYFLRELYPDRNLRTIGDIDILVEEENFDVVVKLLKENNFNFGEDDGHHIQIWKNGVLIELHRNLFEEHRVLSDYFSKPFENIVNVDKFTYKLSAEYDFLYLIGHYAKHINIGAGLRPLCDIYLMLKKCDIDLPYIEKELNKLGLSKFYNMLLNMIYIIFDFKVVSFVEDSSVNEMIEYCIKSGVHGQGSKSNMTHNNVRTVTNGKKIPYLLKRLFIPVRQLFSIYPWTKSIILIPFGYIVRFFEFLFFKRDKLKVVLNYKEDSDYLLLKKLGLLNEDDKYF